MTRHARLGRAEAADAGVAVLDHVVGLVAHRHAFDVPAEEFSVEGPGFRNVIGDVFEPDEFAGQTRDGGGHGEPFDEEGVPRT